MSQPDYEALVQAAIAARARAYAPYSHFSVGAAVQSAAGSVYPGCNIENAAYGPSICAERVALSSAYAAGDRRIAALAVVTPTDDPASPCGICRQVIAELAPDAVVVLANLRGARRITTPQELLPFGFSGAQLAENK
ncbi:MAG: cytidine deaminase [Chloroflexales bacterium]|nr:cytidine deaminase [Chloroflexales bacterium]